MLDAPCSCVNPEPVNMVSCTPLRLFNRFSSCSTFHLSTPSIPGGGGGGGGGGGAGGAFGLKKPMMYLLYA